MKFKTSILLLVVFIALTSANYFFCVAKYSEQLLQEKTNFAKSTEALFNSIETLVDQSLQVIESVDFYYRASDNVERNEFKIFVKPFLEKYDFLQALSWNRLINSDEIGNLESEARLEGLSDFYVKEKNQHGDFVPVAESNEHVVVYYIEPLSGNESAIGFDIASNKDRLAAIHQAREKKAVIATSRINLVQEKNALSFGILVLNPIYHDYKSINADNERLNNLKGFIVGVIRVQDLIKSALIKNIDASNIAVLVQDLDASPEERFLYETDLNISTFKNEASYFGRFDKRFILSRDMTVGGRTWRISFSKKNTGEIIRLHIFSYLSFGFVLLFSIIVCMYINVRINQTNKIRYEVMQKTSEISKFNKRLKLSRDISALLAIDNLDDNYLQQILKIICQYMEWSVGHIYNCKAGKMNPSDTWYTSIDESTIREFKKITMETTFINGEGLPGRILKTGKPLWISDVSKDGNFLRAKVVNNSNVKSGMGFPIFESGEVVMVMEFYSLNIEKNDDSLMHTMMLISDLITISRTKRNAQKLINDQTFAHDQHSIVAFTDSSGKITYANEKFCAISKYSKKELIGQDHRIINSGYHSKEFFQELWKTIAGGNVWKGELKNKAKDGTYYWVDTTIIPFLNDEKKPYQYVAMRTDITDKKEDELKLVEAMKSKSEFISMVSHELRTPLMVIKESVSLVYDGIAGDVNADQKDFLVTAKNNVDRLGRLINDVLDFQKLDSNLMTFVIEEHSINEVVREVGEGFKLALGKKDLSLELELQSELPNVNFDSDRIIQVLTNLLNNAAKFSDKGPIHLITQRLGDNAVKVSVRDEGIGIKEGDLDKLFKSFSQISTDAGRKTGGTGLGLVLCKKILEEHGGQIGVESIFGEGTTFYFVLPIRERRTRKA
ncbi:MAG: PAS domain S-box-containing protein [Candidatus Omnitrophota bacterium]